MVYDDFNLEHVDLTSKFLIDMSHRQTHNALQLILNYNLQVLNWQV